MKKRIIAILLCCMLFLLCGCTSESPVGQQKYKRINFESEALGREISRISEDAIVVNSAKETFSNQMPIYEINSRNITEREFQQMLDNLGLAEDPAYAYDDFELEGNQIDISLIDVTDFSRGYFDMTDEEVEAAAWDVFNKIPFMEGEYECVGILNRYSVDDGTGVHTTRAGVGFYRLLDGVRVISGQTCVLYFDGSGLVEVHINLYEYKKIGNMDMVTLEDAETRIKTPDDISIGKTGNVEEIEVDRVKLLLVNQYYRGCTILQPLYNFIGTATLEDGSQTEFSSKVIAIPESMTYEEE